MSETYQTTMVAHAAVLAAIDPLRSTVKIEPLGTLANGEPQCYLSVTAPNVHDLADRLHFKDGKKLEKLPDPLNVTAMQTALNQAISRIKAGEIEIAVVKAWEVCRG
jgi:hypothetical protein